MWQRVSLTNLGRIVIQTEAKVFIHKTTNKLISTAGWPSCGNVTCTVREEESIVMEYFHSTSHTQTYSLSFFPPSRLLCLIPLFFPSLPPSLYKTMNYGCCLCYLAAAFITQPPRFDGTVQQAVWGEENVWQWVGTCPNHEKLNILSSCPMSKMWPISWAAVDPTKAAEAPLS